MTFNPLNTQTR